MDKALDFGSGDAGSNPVTLKHYFFFFKVTKQNIYKVEPVAQFPALFISPHTPFL